MASNRRIVIEFLGKDVSAGSTAAKVEQKFGKLGGRLDKVGQAAGKMLAVGAIAGGAALYKMSQAAADDAAAQTQLANTLKNAAGASDGQIAATEKWIEAQGKALGITDTSCARHWDGSPRQPRTSARPRSWRRWPWMSRPAPARA